MNNKFFLEGVEFFGLPTSVDLGSESYWLEGYPVEFWFVSNSNAIMLCFDW